MSIVRLLAPTGGGGQVGTVSNLTLSVNLDAAQGEGPVKIIISL